MTAVITSRPTIIAHRGASAIAPENTLLAFRLAIEAGAGMIETDARLSSDGEVMLLHDADLQRTTSCTGSVAEWHSRDLATCDAGYWFAPAGQPNYPYRGVGLAVPRLADLIELTKLLNRAVRLNVEIKIPSGEIDDSTYRPVDRVVDTLRATHTIGNVLVSSFSREAIARVKALEPTIRTAYICGPLADLRETTAAVQGDGHDAIHPHHSLLMSGDTAKRLVDVMHEAGLELNVWTVNDPQRMLELAAAEVDGIITDDPGRLRKVLRGASES